MNNLSSVIGDPLNLTTTRESWEMVATFWIEGVATPLVSLCGLIGRIEGAFHVTLKHLFCEL